MRKKIFLNMCLTALITVLLATVLTTVVYYSDFAGHMEDEVRETADSIKPAVEQLGAGYLESLKNPKNRLTLIDGDGTVLYDSQADAAAMENHGDREEVREALASGAGEVTRVSDTIDEKTYYYAVKLEDGQVLRIAATTDTVFAALFSVLPWIVGSALLAVAVTALLSSYLTKRIVAPINQLDLEHPEENLTYDEISPLLTKISKQNQAIAAQMRSLKEKQEEFTAITENMSEGFLVLDHHTDILSYNTSALRLLGCPDAQAGGRESALTLNRSASFRSVVDGALSGKRSQQLLRENGRCCQVLGNPVLRDGEVVGAVVVILDITEREERENLRREFTANVSHELKTPLTSISGFAEIMQNGMVKPADVPRFAGNIYTESQRLISLVDDIMRLSRLDEEDVQLPSEDLDLLALAQDVARRLEPAAKEQGLTMTVQGSGSIRGVRSIVDEMVYNLCDNAVKYNRKGGSVTITVTESSRDVTLSVADTGIGIPAVDRERVFERFYRVDKSHSKEIGGTGLGLSIVKHGAAFHNAQVRLESQEGKGTTVTLTFPRRYRV